jgi:signal transduction histidine kinase
VLDPARAVFRLAACAGLPPAQRTELAQIELGDQAPMVRALRPGIVIDVPDTADQALVPPHVMRRFGVASALVVPIARAGQVTGILVPCQRRRRTGFAPRQRRIALGIAHATAIAQENARLIADLQGASRLKSAFVSTMSHELRTPVNVIAGYAELLRDGTFDALTPAQTDVVERIGHQAVELLGLIDATLDLGRLEAGREVVSVGPIDLEGLLGELRRELEPLAAPGVALGCTAATRAARGDRAKVKTILKNLIGNALKFTTCGRVDASASVVDGTLLLEVRDTGTGIAADDLPVIFEMFRQVGTTSGGRFGGVGLGLHIVSHLVELLGGTIAVESAPGVGSTFTVRLPT